MGRLINDTVHYTGYSQKGGTDRHFLFAEGSELELAIKNDRHAEVILGGESLNGESQIVLDDLAEAVRIQPELHANLGPVLERLGYTVLPAAVESGYQKEVKLKLQNAFRDIKRRFTRYQKEVLAELGLAIDPKPTGNNHYRVYSLTEPGKSCFIGSMVHNRTSVNYGSVIAKEIYDTFFALLA